MFPEKQCDLLALGMVADVPLDKYLADHPVIRKICFCLDNDEPGQKAERQMMDKYTGQDYLVEGGNIPPEYKDMNEWLKAVRKKQVDSTFHYQKDKLL